jgi:hypothetical protein
MLDLRIGSIDVSCSNENLLSHAARRGPEIGKSPGITNGHPLQERGLHPCNRMRGRRLRICNQLSPP